MMASAPMMAGGSPVEGYAEAAPVTQEQQVKLQQEFEAERRSQDEMKKRKQQDAENVVIAMCISACVNIFLLVVPMFGGSWAYRSFVGLGLKMMSIKTSLFSIDVDIQCGKNFVEDVLCQAGQRMHGRHSLHQGQSMSCALSSKACDVMGRIHTARLLIFLSYSCTIIMLGVGAVFLYQYWFIECEPRLRKIAVGLHASAPFVGMFGLALWSMYVPDLSELPHGWTGSGSVLRGLSLFGYHAIQMFPYGWCWMWSFVVFFEMCIGLCIWPWFFRKHNKEDRFVRNREDEQYALEHAMITGDYSTVGGLAQNPMAAQAARDYSMQQAQDPAAMPIVSGGMAPPAFMPHLPATAGGAPMPPMQVQALPLEPGAWQAGPGVMQGDFGLPTSPAHL